MDGRASFGVIATATALPNGLLSEHITTVDFVIVAASTHPLTAHRGMIPRDELARHVQLVLTDRTDLSAGQEWGVISPSTWHLADLLAKHAFLVSGLGWGGMPLHTVARDIAEGRLVELSTEDIPHGWIKLPMSVVYPLTAPPGPAG